MEIIKTSFNLAAVALGVIIIFPILYGLFIVSSVSFIACLQECPLLVIAAGILLLIAKTEYNISIQKKRSNE